MTYGELEESIANFNEAVTVLRRIGTEEPLASALSQLAAAQQSADSAGAEKTWREALEIYERLGDRQSTMAALERLAVLRRSADRSETRQLFGRALALATELEDGATEARIRNSLAVIAWQCGEIEEAEKQYRMAAALLRQGDNGESLGVVLNGLGAVVARQNRAGDALVILEEALASNRKHGQTGAEADSLAALGAAARIEGDLKDAGTWYQQCVECRRSQDDRAGEGWALQRLGEVSHDAGEWEKAQAFASAALAIGREVGDTDLESLASKLQSTDNTQKPD